MKFSTKQTKGRNLGNEIWIIENTHYHIRCNKNITVTWMTQFSENCQSIEAFFCSGNFHFT